MDYPATYPVILSYNKLPCINHFQPPSRPSCQWKPNFKQMLHRIHSVHIVLQLVLHDLVTGLLVLWGQNYGIQYLVENAWGLENWPRFSGCTQTYPSAWISPVLRLWTPTPCLNLPLCMNLPRYGVCDALAHPQPCLRTCIPFTHFSLGPSLKKIGVAPTHPAPPPSRALPTLWSHLYCCSYAMKPDGRRANHTIVEKSWPNRKETLIIPAKLQPNAMHSQLGVISVRNRISRLKKRCIIKPIRWIRHFVDQ